MSSKARAVWSELNFLSRDALYETEKPYSLRFTPTPPSSPILDKPDASRAAPLRHNLRTHKVTLEICDARELASSPKLEVNGFALTRVPTSMAYSDFSDHDKIEAVYAKELQQHLKSVFHGARHVRVIDYVVRRRHPSFPTSTGEEYGSQQPATLVHLDFSHDEAISMIRTLYGGRAEEILKSRWQIINTWRPLKGPLKDWPLAVCDSRSFSLPRDAQTADVVYPTWAYENVLVHHHDEQRWFYFSNMEEWETMLFACSGSSITPDGKGTISGSCPHASFHLPQDGTSGPVIPRESVESRAFIFYGPDECDFPVEVGNVYGERR
ncbi:hypothetical protein F5Y17DRAFT_420860 [Xylariaceae sp. FL0594]|nr:hypothetical protein F5Y17DRAFT_420860 [Xylariaceae sp. FL0594]